jgi:hypothetical protein
VAGEDGDWLLWLGLFVDPEREAHGSAERGEEVFLGVDAAGCSSLLLVAAMVGLAAIVRLSLEAG